MKRLHAQCNYIFHRINPIIWGKVKKTATVYSRLCWHPPVTALTKQTISLNKIHPLHSCYETLHIFSIKLWTCFLLRQSWTLEHGTLVWIEPQVVIQGTALPVMLARLMNLFGRYDCDINCCFEFCQVIAYSLLFMKTQNSIYLESKANWVKLCSCPSLGLDY